MATVIGAIGVRLRQPLIVAFIAVGILAGPSVLDWVTADDEIDLLSKLGKLFEGKGGDLSGFLVAIGWLLLGIVVVALVVLMVKLVRRRSASTWPVGSP